MRICWRWTVFKLGQMLWAWFSWWNKLFSLLPVRFSWPATISGGWEGLVCCRPIPVLFSFFKPTKELINLFAFAFEIEALLKQIQHTDTLHPLPLFITYQKYSTPPHILCDQVWFWPQYLQTNSLNWSPYISLKKLVGRIWSRSKIDLFVINLLILLDFALDNLWILLGENWCWSLLGLKG